MHRPVHNYLKAGCRFVSHLFACGLLAFKLLLQAVHVINPRADLREWCRIACARLFVAKIECLHSRDLGGGPVLGIDKSKKLAALSYD